jgi:hypothetical protein
MYKKTLFVAIVIYLSVGLGLIGKTLLRDTPYVGDRIGEETYEVVKVTFNGDIVQSVDFRIMSEEDFKKDRPVE